MEEVDHCGMLYGRLFGAIEEEMTNDHLIFNFTFDDEHFSEPDIEDDEHNKTKDQMNNATNNNELNKTTKQSTPD